jgi:tetratricopeptide (TPR) repeat protein
VGTLLASFATVAVAKEEDFGDLVARIQFDSYAADPRALQQDVQSLKQLEVDESTALLRHYYLAYGHMKLSEALATKDRSDAKRAASECVRHADDVVGQEPKRMSARERARVDMLYGELWAIKGTCAATEAELSLLPGSTIVSLSSLSSSKAREKALLTAPNDPRVQLLAAIYLIKHAKSTQEKDDALRKMRSVADLFDALPNDQPDMPDWGQAEALAWTAQCYLERGDKIAARNAIERALVLAPDYAWARSLQTQIKTAK